MKNENKEFSDSQRYNSLEKLMKEICMELHLNYISDIRNECNRVNVLQFLDKYDISSKNGQAYKELIDYIELSII